MNKRKWMTTLEMENYKWLSESTKATGVSGSTILNKLIERERKEKSSKFRDELVQTKIQMQLRKITETQMMLEAKKAELTKRAKIEKTDKSTVSV